MADVFRSKRAVKYQDIAQSNADGLYSIYIECKPSLLFAYRKGSFCAEQCFDSSPVNFL